MHANLNVKKEGKSHDLQLGGKGPNYFALRILQCMQSYSFLYFLGWPHVGG